MAANVETITVSSGEPWDSVHNTLDTTLADTITVNCTGESYRVEVVNKSTTQPLYVAIGATAVADANGTAYIPPAASAGPPATWPWRMGPGVCAVSIVGSGNTYSMHVVPASAW